MAMAGGTRVVVGRATSSSFTAMAGMSSSRCSVLSLSPSSPCLALFSPHSPPRSSFPAADAASLRLRCPQFPPCWGSRSFPNSIVAFSSSSPSVSTVDTVPSSESGPAAAAAALELDALDIRVGRVLKAWKHPEADSLYVEEVDLSEPEGPRTICSGLVSYLSLEELQGRAVLVLANLKARNMRGVKSNGMLLAASNSEHTTVQLLSPPEGATPGERIWFGEATDQANQAPAGTPNQVQKKKIWESIQPRLKTTEDCVATFQSKPMRTSMGVVTCQSLQGANIS